MQTDKSEINQNRQLDDLMEWVSQQLGMGRVPRFADVIDYAHNFKGWSHLSKKHISGRLRLHPNYLMNAPQQRAIKRHRKYRSVMTNTLGNLHCDLGFFSITDQYSTPPTYRAGFLVCKDVLSRFVYAVPLKKHKDARALINAFDEVFANHETTFGIDGHKILTVSFDRERGIMSKEVQRYLKQTRGLAFHDFKFSSSKAKAAESTIKQIRTTMVRLTQSLEDKRWWVHLSTVVNELNSRPLRIDGKKFRLAPRDINKQTLASFLSQLHKKVPKYYWSQFEINPRLVNFKYSIGTFVRPKLIVTSSAVIGVKRSQVTLEKIVFVITDQIAYVSADFHVMKAYRCSRIDTSDEIEIFDEADITETVA